MKPTPLMLQGDYEGDYLQIDRTGSDSEPDAVCLPQNLVFLKEKR
jgi:hypothetical protein